MKDDKIYEVGYLVLPTFSIERVPETVGNIKGILEKKGAGILSEDMPKETPLAYAIDKVIENRREHFDRAYFGWLKFELPADQITEIKKELEGIKEILRFIIVKTVRENTLLRRRPFERMRLPTVPVKPAEAKTIPSASVEEIDKRIEELAM